MLLASALALAPPDLAARIEARRTELGVPGAAVAVWRGGRLVLRRGFGTTERGGGRRVGTDTAFEAASLTKPVFAAAVLRLAEAGRIDLDAPLVRYLGGPYRHRQRPWDEGSRTDEVDDPRLARITARGVLSHRTGLPNLAIDRPLTFVGEPNVAWGYSGEGFLLLQRAVERLTGEPAGATVQRLVLGPLGMRRSTMVRGPLVTELARNAAWGYTHAGERVPGTSLGLAFGSLLTTLDDYSRFMRWSCRYRPFLAPQTVADDVAGVDWGLGWGLARDGADRDLFQWGWNDGYRSLALMNPRTGNGLLMLTSSDDGMELAPLVAGAAFDRRLGVLRFPMLGLRPTPPSGSPEASGRRAGPR